MAMLVFRTMSVRNLGFHVDSKKISSHSQSLSCFLLNKFCPTYSGSGISSLPQLVLLHFLYLFMGSVSQAYWLLCRITVQVMVCWAHQFFFLHSISLYSLWWLVHYVSSLLSRSQHFPLYHHISLLILAQFSQSINFDSFGSVLDCILRVGCTMSTWPCILQFMAALEFQTKIEARLGANSEQDRAQEWVSTWHLGRCCLPGEHESLRI